MLRFELRHGRRAKHKTGSSAASIRRRLAGVVMAMATCAPLVGECAEETTALPSEDTFLDELPVVLSVTRLAQPKSETPAAVTVIDSDMIRAAGVRNIPDLFWLVPGFQVGYNHAIIPTVTYHGLSDGYARRMQVLVDGRSVYNAFWGGVFWIDLPLAIDDIEHIDVIRGPNAASYGSNSFLGVINIVTRHASQNPGSYLKLAAGEHDIRDGVLRQSWSGEASDSRLTLSYQQDDGFDGLPDWTHLPVISYRGDYRLGKRDTLEFQAGISGGRHGEGHFDDAEDPARSAEVHGQFELLRWQRTLAADNEVSIQFYHNYWKLTDDYLTDPINLSLLDPTLGMAERVAVNLSQVEDRYDLELQHVVSPWSEWRFVWGGGARLDRLRSQTWFGTGDAINNRVYRVFGNAEWRLRADTIINAGAMWEDDDIAGTNLLPRLALNHHLSPDHTLRLAASKATRTPALIEAKADARIFHQGVLIEHLTQSPGDLDAETMTSVEIGYLGQLYERKIAVDLRLFRDRMKNLITEFQSPNPDADGRILSYRNEGRALVRGVEIQLTYRPQRATRLMLNYASMQAEVTGISADALSDAALHERSVPAFSGGALLMHRFSDRWEGSLYYRRVADMEWLHRGGKLVDGNGRLDLRLARSFRLDNAKAEVALVIQNLGPDSMSFANENTFDRRTFVTFSLNR